MKLLCFAVCMCFSVSLAAQTGRHIYGKVTLALTESPLAKVSVFVNGSAKGTATNEQGLYRITDIPPGTYELVISSVGFETIVRRFSTDELPLELNFQLRPKATELEPIVVEPFLEDGWKKYGKFFLENFIGTTDFARNCELKNHKVLRFRYSKKDNTLEVFADKPLIIENRALGYRIHYQLETFVQDWKNNSLVFTGYTLFKDIATDDRRLSIRRRSNRSLAYRGSLKHFVHTLYSNRVQEEGFEVLRMVQLVNLEKQRIKQIVAEGLKRSGTSPNRNFFETANLSYDTSKYYQKVLMEPDSTKIMGRYLLNADSLLIRKNDSTTLLYFPDYIQVTYTRAKEEQGYLDFIRLARNPGVQQSYATLVRGVPVNIDKNGTYLPPPILFLYEYWSWSEKIAQLLPMEYNEDD